MKAPLLNWETASTASDFIRNVRSSLRHFRACRRLSREVPSAAMGFRFSGNRSMMDGAFEPQETAVFRRLAPKYDVLINIGANIGYYCCLGLQANKQVVAFEPMPENQQLLYRNLAANGWENSVEVFPLALSDRPGLSKMYGDGTGASLIQGWANSVAEEHTFVPSSTLDLVLKDRFVERRCLLVVDIEGAEWSMLQGAGQFLKRNPKPIWLMEIAISEHQPAGIPINPRLLETFDMFWKHGYRASTAHTNSRPIERSEVERVVHTGKDTLGTHNFLFAADCMGIA